MFIMAVNRIDMIAQIRDVLNAAGDEIRAPKTLGNLL